MWTFFCRRRQLSIDYCQERPLGMSIDETSFRQSDFTLFTKTFHWLPSRENHTRLWIHQNFSSTKYWSPRTLRPLTHSPWVPPRKLFLRSQQTGTYGFLLCDPEQQTVRFGILSIQTWCQSRLDREAPFAQEANRTTVQSSRWRQYFRQGWVWSLSSEKRSLQGRISGVWTPKECVWRPYFFHPGHNHCPQCHLHTEGRPSSIEHPWSNQKTPCTKRRSTKPRDRAELLQIPQGTSCSEYQNLAGRVDCYLSEAKEYGITEATGSQPVRDFLLAVRPKDTSFAYTHFPSDATRYPQSSWNNREVLSTPSAKALQGPSGNETHSAFSAKSSSKTTTFRGQKVYPSTHMCNLTP